MLKRTIAIILAAFSMLCIIPLQGCSGSLESLSLKAAIAYENADYWTLVNMINPDVLDHILKIENIEKNDLYRRCKETSEDVRFWLEDRGITTSRFALLRIREKSKQEVEDYNDNLKYNYESFKWYHPNIVGVASTTVEYYEERGNESTKQYIDIGFIKIGNRWYLDIRESYQLIDKIR